MVERTGNTIGGEGRRQHDEDDPRYGDKPDREERLADEEARQGEEEQIEAQLDDEPREPVPEPDEAGTGDVASPEGVKPGTASEIADAAREREQ